MVGLKSKKSNILDFILIMVFLFFFAIILIISYFLVTTVDATDIFVDNSDATNMINQTENALLSFDGLVVFLLIGLSLFTLISAYFVWTHPAFFIIGFILLAVFIMIAAQISNAYESFNTGDLASSFSAFPKTNQIILNLPLYLALMGIVTLVVIGVSYAKEY